MSISILNPDTFKMYLVFKVFFKYFAHGNNSAYST